MILKGTNVFEDRTAHYDGKLEQINLYDKRFYKRAEDLYYPSVTTILEYMPKNKFFQTWQKDVGHNADIIMRRAAEEGTQVHDAIELLLKGEEVHWIDENAKVKYSDFVWGMILKYKDFWNQANPIVELNEEFIYSDEHKYAGTLDQKLKIEGQKWVIDIKTSNTVHKSFELQVAAYVRALREHGHQVDRAGILWLKSSRRSESKKPGEYYGKGWELIEIKDLDHNFRLFKNIYELFTLENPEAKPSIQTYPISVKL